MAGFIYKGQLKGGQQSPGTMNLIIANSATIYKGSAVMMSSGYVAAGTAGNKLIGICIGLVNKDGIDLDSANSNSYDGTYTPGEAGVGNYAAASDNVTDKQIKAVVVVDKDALWESACTGLAAAGLFGFHNLTDSITVAAQAAGEVAAQLQLVAFESATLGTFRIVESQLDPYSVS